MSIYIIRSLFIAVLSVCVLPFISFADEEPVEYLIKKGDTLWGISDRFLKDPNYWPSLWSKNPQVTNPHLIYPGHKVRFADGRIEVLPPASEAVAQKAVSRDMVETEEVTEEKLFIARGNEGRLIEKEVKTSGKIIAGHHDRTILGEDDIVFTDISTSNGGTDGQKYTIIRKSVTINHPLTSETLGTKYYPLGTLQLTRVGSESSRAIITRSFKEVEPGDLLMPYRELKRREIAIKAAAAPVKGMIVESYEGKEAVAAGDTIYLDIGKKDGLEVGLIFS